MKKVNEGSRFFRVALIISLILSALAMIYSSSLMTFHIHTVYIGFIWGFIVGMLGTAAEQFIFNHYGLRWKFTVLLLSRTVFYFILITSCTAWLVITHETWMTGKSFIEAFHDEVIQSYFTRGDFTQDVMFALLVILFISFVRQISRLMGRQVFKNYITGKYHQPVSEYRMIMFLDLNDSTSIAEKLGAKRYHSFINEIFFSITPAVVEHKGEIYQYVGDEVIITWREKQGVDRENCVRCFFDVNELIRMDAARFSEKYGYVPSFKAGLHFGDVMIGEIGDVKREIAFHGDTINTAARIRSECSSLRRNFLVSATLLHRLNHPETLDAESMGRIHLKGKSEDLELFSVRAAA